MYHFSSYAKKIPKKNWVLTDTVFLFLTKKKTNIKNFLEKEKGFLILNFFRNKFKLLNLY